MKKYNNVHNIKNNKNNIPNLNIKNINVDIIINATTLEILKYSNLKSL